MPVDPSLASVIEEAEKLLKDITPGEWGVVYRKDDYGEDECFVRFGPTHGDPPSWEEDSTLPRVEDAAFIAAAPRLLRALLDHLIAGAGRREALVKLIEDWRKDADEHGSAWQDARRNNATYLAGEEAGQRAAILNCADQLASLREDLR